MGNIKRKSADILADFIECDRPIIYLETFDFDRADEIITEACDSLVKASSKREKREFYFKEFVNSLGERDFTTKLPATNNENLADFLKRFSEPRLPEKHKILVLREIHDSITNEMVYAALQALAKRTAMSGNLTAIIVDTQKVIPPELEKLVSVVDIELPDEEEIRSILQITANEYNGECEEKGLAEVVENLKGFSPFEIAQIARSAMRSNMGKIDYDCIKIIEEARQQAFKKSNLLDLQIGDEKMKLGGFEYFKNYLERERVIFRSPAKAQKAGIKAPTGIVLLGMPGCGKSLSAHWVSKVFDCPLLKLDVGRLMGKYVGESEANLRRAIRIAEESAPCILWIDELEKAFSGINGGSGGGDGGVSTRMFGSFLTWLQEKTKPVYVFATANDITNLPPEFLRRGRFDEIFKVGLPQAGDIAEIFKTCIEKRVLEGVKGIDYKKLVGLCSHKKYSGADIESIVNEACKTAFNRNGTLNFDDLAKAIRDTESSYSADPKKYAAIEKILAERKAKDVSTGASSSVKSSR